MANLPPLLLIVGQEVFIKDYRDKRDEKVNECKCEREINGYTDRDKLEKTSRPV